MAALRAQQQKERAKLQSGRVRGASEDWYAGAAGGASKSLSPSNVNPERATMVPVSVPPGVGAPSASMTATRQSAPLAPLAMPAWMMQKGMAGGGGRALRSPSGMLRSRTGQGRIGQGQAGLVVSTRRYNPLLSSSTSPDGSSDAFGGSVSASPEKSAALVRGVGGVGVGVGSVSGGGSGGGSEGFATVVRRKEFEMIAGNSDATGTATSDANGGGDAASDHLQESSRKRGRDAEEDADAVKATAAVVVEVDSPADATETSAPAGTPVRPDPKSENDASLTAVKPAGLAETCLTAASLQSVSEKVPENGEPRWSFGLATQDEGLGGVTADSVQTVSEQARENGGPKPSFDLGTRNGGVGGGKGGSGSVHATETDSELESAGEGLIPVRDACYGRGVCTIFFFRGS